VHRMGVDPPHAKQVLTPDDLQRLQKAADSIYVDHGVVDYAVNLVMATRAPSTHGLPELDELISYGASPRASLGLVAGARAIALLRGRTYALPQDVFDVAPDILRHRIVLSYEALAQGLGVEHVLVRVLSTVPAPRIAPSQAPSAASRVAPTATPGAPTQDAPTPPPAPRSPSPFRPPSEVDQPPTPQTPTSDPSEQTSPWSQPRP